MWIKVIFPLLLILVGSYPLSHARSLNGFDLTNALVPTEEIFHGGPPKDGIPALDKPRFTSSADAHALNEDDYVLGVNVRGEAKAYPIRIMNWHEVVNDTIGGHAIVVTYCPLCGSGMVFDANVQGKVLSFGVSGLLYNSDVLLYDRESHSLWSQIESMAITGAHKGKKLVALAAEHTTWRAWRKKHANTLVLDFNTGFRRNYSRNPYADYAESKQLYFPVQFRSLGLHPKELVIGLEINGVSKAWPFVELRKSKGQVMDSLKGELVKVEFDRTNNSARVLDKSGRLLPATTLFWFAWSGFHPDTLVYQYE